MNLILRKETPSDFTSVFNLIKSAFESIEFSDHKEQFLVERLRKSDAFIPKLSLVAESWNQIVGHILLTRIKIINNKNQYTSLALAPVSVLPEYQNRGIGGKLILESHKIAKGLGYSSIVLLGHESYYPKFGYVRADTFGISLPFDVPPENCMVVELIEDALAEVSGTVEYPKEFFG